eukprot:3730633-Amphidinium_carterae.1
MTCMTLLITTLLRSHFATNTVGIPEDYGGDAMETGENKIVYDLTEKNLEYLTHLPGDTDEDAIRIRQIEVLDDDIQSIDDEEYYKKREKEEREDPEGTFWRRSQLEGHHEAMMEAYRGEQARDREIRRDNGEQIRFRGTKAELQEMRNSLLAITVSGHRQRLQERERTRPQPKAGVRVP